MSERWGTLKCIGGSAMNTLIESNASEFVLDQERHYFGRLQKRPETYLIPQPFISGEHFIIFRDPHIKSMRLKNLGANGTYVNNTFLMKNKSLENDNECNLCWGDTIKFVFRGDVKAEFELTQYNARELAGGGPGDQQPENVTMTTNDIEIDNADSGANNTDSKTKLASYEINNTSDITNMISGTTATTNSNSLIDSTSHSNKVMIAPKTSPTPAVAPSLSAVSTSGTSNSSSTFSPSIDGTPSNVTTKLIAQITTLRGTISRLNDQLMECRQESAAQGNNYRIELLNVRQELSNTKEQLTEKTELVGKLEEKLGSYGSPEKNNVEGVEMMQHRMLETNQTVLLKDALLKQKNEQIASLNETLDGLQAAVSEENERVHMSEHRIRELEMFKTWAERKIESNKQNASQVSITIQKVHAAQELLHNITGELSNITVDIINPNDFPPKISTPSSSSPYSAVNHKANTMVGMSSWVHTQLSNESMSQFNSFSSQSHQPNRSPSALVTLRPPVSSYSHDNNNDNNNTIVTSANIDIDANKSVSIIEKEMDVEEENNQKDEPQVEKLDDVEVDLKNGPQPDAQHDKHEDEQHEQQYDEHEDEQQDKQQVQQQEQQQNPNPTAQNTSASDVNQERDDRYNDNLSKFHMRIGHKGSGRGRGKWPTRGRAARGRGRALMLAHQRELNANDPKETIPKKRGRPSMDRNAFSQDTFAMSIDNLGGGSGSMSQDVNQYQGDDNNTGSNGGEREGDSSGFGSVAMSQPVGLEADEMSKQRSTSLQNMLRNNVKRPRHEGPESNDETKNE